MSYCKIHFFHRNLAIIGLGFVLYIFSTICTAALPITLTVVQPDRIGSAGSTETFSGTIANNTGADIWTNDLFLNFSGFDPSAVSPTQLLGSPNLVITNGGTSPTLDLFSFSLGANAVAGTKYLTDVFIQDGNFVPNKSDLVTVSVLVPIPEPATYALWGIGLLVVLFYTGNFRSRGVRF